MTVGNDQRQVFRICAQGLSNGIYRADIRIDDETREAIVLAVHHSIAVGESAG